MRQRVILTILGGGLVFGATVAHAAAKIVEEADDVCDALDNPCVIDSPIQLARGTTLDFSGRRVEVSGDGQIILDDNSNVIQCGSFSLSTDQGRAIVVAAPQNDSKTPFLTIRTVGACSADLSRTCSAVNDCDLGTCLPGSCSAAPVQQCAVDADCELGSCSITVCDRFPSQFGWQQCVADADCFRGPCDFASRSCMGDTTIRCFTDFDCDFGACGTGGPRCEGNVSVTCLSDDDCSAGLCGPATCQTAPSRACAGDADCQLGECATDDGSVAIDSVVNVSGKFPGGFVIDAIGPVQVRASIFANSLDVEFDGGFIDIVSDSDLSVAATLRARGGALSTGGEIYLKGRGSLTMSGLADVTGGDFDGGDISLVSDEDVVLTGRLRANAKAGLGWGGRIELLAGRDVLVLSGSRFTVKAHGKSDGDAGAGGDVLLEAERDVIVSQGAKIVSRGARPTGDTGYIELFAEGAIRFGGEIRSRAPFAGGDILFDAGTSLDLLETSKILIQAAEGPIVDIVSDGAVSVYGKIEIKGSGGDAFFWGLTVAARGPVELGADINVRSRRSNASFPEVVYVAGCEISLVPGASLSTKVPNGRIALRGNNGIFVPPGSRIIADRRSGEITFSFSADGPGLVVEGQVVPEPSLNPLPGSPPACPQQLFAAARGRGHHGMNRRMTATGTPP